MRSVNNSARSSQASSQQSMRLGGELDVGDNDRVEPVELSGGETPGLDTASESDSDREEQTDVLPQRVRVPQIPRGMREMRTRMPCEQGHKEGVPE